MTNNRPLSKMEIVKSLIFWAKHGEAANSAALVCARFWMKKIDLTEEPISRKEKNFGL